MEEQEKRDEMTTPYLRPFPIFILLLVTIFIFEAVIMAFFTLIPPLPTFNEAIIDAFLLTILASPLFFLVVVRPMVRNIEELKQAKAALREAHDKLEVRVEERTANLKESNILLKDEIAEREKVETALRESEGEFRSLSQEFNTLLDAIPDSLILLSPDLEIEWANKSCKCGNGTNARGGTKGHCYDICHGQKSVCEDCPTLKSFETGEAAESRITRPDGRINVVRAYPIKDETGKVTKVIEIATDVTDKIKLQEEAMTASHLASLGELAAGVAHEINNPINGIINYAQMLVNKNPRGSDTFDVAGRIMAEGDRVAVIVRGLLSFAREGRREGKEEVSLSGVLSDCLTLTRKQFEKEHIALTIDMDDTLPRVKAHHQQLQQVFLNIMNNARYALNEKFSNGSPEKKLEISSEEIEGADGRYVRVIFHDHGPGIPAGVREKMFDPFFSTKPKQEGTGLGLSISHGIVSDHGGRLHCEAEEGEYTRIMVDLPVIKAKEDT